MFLAVTAAIIALAVLARLSVAGIGPFPATVDAVSTQADGLAVTLTVTNEGGSAGRTTCRLARARTTAPGPRRSCPARRSSPARP